MTPNASMIQTMLDQGHQICPGCRGVCRPERTACPHCHTSLSRPGGAEAPGHTQTRKRRPTGPVTNQQAPRATGTTALGSFQHHPYVDLVVHGDPVQQGSLSAPAPGVLKRSAGPELNKWRNLIAAEAERVCGAEWVAPNCPLAVSMVLTVPPPESAPAGRPDGYRDLDKLARAVGDALCPRAGFRTISSDMRITNYPAGPAKTHPRPHHTHPMALDRPGVWIRVAPDHGVSVSHTEVGWSLSIPMPDPTNPPTSHLPERIDR